MGQTIKCTGAFHVQLTPSNAVMGLFVSLIIQAITLTYSQPKIYGGSQ